MSSNTDEPQLTRRQMRERRGVDTQGVPIVGAATGSADSGEASKAVPAAPALLRGAFLAVRSGAGRPSAACAAYGTYGAYGIYGAYDAYGIRGNCRWRKSGACASARFAAMHNGA